MVTEQAAELEPRTRRSIREFVADNARRIAAGSIFGVVSVAGFVMANEGTPEDCEIAVCPTDEVPNPTKAPEATHPESEGDVPGNPPSGGPIDSVPVLTTKGTDPPETTTTLPETTTTLPETTTTLPETTTTLPETTTTLPETTTTTVAIATTTTIKPVITVPDTQPPTPAVTD